MSFMSCSSFSSSSFSYNKMSLAMSILMTLSWGVGSLWPMWLPTHCGSCSNISWWWQQFFNPQKAFFFCPKWSPPTPSASPILLKSTLGFILATLVWKRHPHISGHIRILFSQLLFHNNLKQPDNDWPKSEKHSFPTVINKLTSSCFKLQVWA